MTTTVMTLDGPVIIGTPDDEVMPNAMTRTSEPDETPEYVCEKCGTALRYGGRGRKPRKCSPNNGGNASCYGTGSASTPGSQRPRAGKSLVTQLEHALFTIGTMVMTADRFDGATIINGAPDLASALDAIAQQNPKFRKWLEKSSNSAAYIALALAVARISIPIAAHHNLIQVDEKEAYAMMFPEQSG